MPHPIPNPPASTTAERLASFFRPLHPVLAAEQESGEDVVELMKLFVQEETERVCQLRAEKERREKLVHTDEVSTIIPITPRHARALARRGGIKSHQKEGSRLVYFKIGDLLDWQAANIREDGALRRAPRKCPADGKEKKGK